MDAPRVAGRARERLLRFLADDRPESGVWIDRLKGLFRFQDVPVFAAAAEALFHVQFPEAEAEAFLRQVEEHRAAIARRLRRDPGLVVAGADYLSILGGPPGAVCVAERPGPDEAPRSPSLRPTGILPDPVDPRRALQREMRRRRRRPAEIGVVRLALDGVSDVALAYGRMLADLAADRAATILQRTLRDSDAVGPFDEMSFAAVLPETSRRGAYEAAERARRAVGASLAEGGLAGREVRLTLSGGIASFPEDGQTASELWERAEAGLLAAQTAGGDRIWLHHAERRRDVRHRAREGWTLLLGSEEDHLAFPARALDLSRSGVCLETAQPFRPLERVRLLLGGLAEPGPPAVGPWVVIGRVARVEGPAGPTRGAGRRIAIAFDAPLPESCLKPRIVPWTSPEAAGAGGTS